MVLRVSLACGQRIETLVCLQTMRAPNALLGWCLALLAAFAAGPVDWLLYRGMSPIRLDHGSGQSVPGMWSRRVCGRLGDRVCSLEM
jgi:hypothetical protein